jgi:hypothetical protein
MTENELKNYYSDISQFWQYIKEFLSREDDKTDTDKYWKDAVDKYEAMAKGKSKFMHSLFMTGMEELERIKKCSNEQ